MPALISVVTSARWIDLSENHKQLREYLESSVEDACVENRPDKVIMIKGAFGIGKTNTLHYLFHYGWCKINVPVLFVSLEKLYPLLKRYADSLPNGKIGNVDLGSYLNERVNSALESLAEGNPNDDTKLFFFDWKDSDLETFCNSFNKLELSKYENDRFVREEFLQLTPDLIRSVINTKNRPLLLIDEFETKFTKLKSLIDSSNGGELRELFDDVVEKRVDFNLIIGNGPASGYELKNSNSNQGSDDAEASRLVPKQVPFPYPETTKDFLETTNRGLLNFAWWASRCRARHFLRLKESVGSLDNLLNKNSYAEFLNDFSFINESIESSNEGSSPISYVKTEYLTDFPEAMKDSYLTRLITEIKPLEISFDDYRDSIVSAKKYLYCSDNTISVSKNVMVALSEDIKDNILSNHKADGRYLELDYDKTLRKYFDFFLKSIANEEGEIVFGMSDDLDSEHSFCDLFLLPLIHLCYDFIAQYEEESLPSNKQALEFLLSTSTNIKNSLISKNIRSLFPKVFRLFKKNNYLEGKGYIQLSLGAIRETFEQPIGEPRLNYRGQNLLTMLDSIADDDVIPLIKHTDGNLELYFIPDLPDRLLMQYIDILKEHYESELDNRLHRDGFLSIGVVYLADNSMIEKLRISLLEYNDSNGDLRPVSQVGKFNFIKLNSIRLNFPTHTSDFIDSITKIGIVGGSNGDLREFINETNGLLEISDIVQKIKQSDWTERKELRRTIEHFDKLILSNDKSELKAITSHIHGLYDDKLNEIITNRHDFASELRKYSLNDTEYSNMSMGAFTKRLIYLFLVDNISIPDRFLDFLKSCNDLNFMNINAEKNARVEIDSFRYFLGNNDSVIRSHYQTYSYKKTIVKDIHGLARLLQHTDKAQTIEEFTEYLKYKDEHYFRSYCKKLGDYNALSFSESIFNLEYGSEIDLEDSKKQLITSVDGYKKKINNVRAELVQCSDSINRFLNLKDSPFEYESGLGKYNTKILVEIEKILEYNHSISLQLVFIDVIKYFDDIIAASIEFKDQLLSLIEIFTEMRGEITEIQNKVNSYYIDPFISNILTRVLGVNKQNGDYYWLQKILPTIKSLPSYASLFNKSVYLPNKSKVFDSEALETFITDIKSKYQEKKEEIDKMVGNLEGHVSEVQSIIELEEELNELLNVGE